MWRAPTARAITSTEVSNAEMHSVAISSFARGESGIVSVGLKAVELVTDNTSNP
jgi:hypothetical protein